MTTTNDIVTPSASLVVLTTGDRPAELDAALRSAMAQRDTAWAELLVVFNGVNMAKVPSGVVTISTEQNEGIPEGRNLGVAATTGDVIVFLDDDACFLDTGMLASALCRFAADPRLGAVSFRIQDEFGGTARRHVPRIRGRFADKPGEVAGFLGGAAAIRRSAFNAAGGYPGAFFYSMEETDLALGIIDAGFKIWYEPSVVLFHPKSEPGRHENQIERTARNRVLLARRRLPWVIGFLYVGDWWMITTFRNRFNVRALRSQWRGTVDGLRATNRDRRPITWRSVWRLVRLRRPPIV